ncbi:MAG: hypothetical protein WBX08_22070, partial [Candidatus Sulfotelmatobacter sp.]
MTGLTGLRKTTTMRIGMAIVAAAKRDSGVARQFVLAGSVTLLARNFDVQSGERITRERMIELANIDLFPLRKVVTLQAVGAKPTLMLVLMTVDALGGNTQKCFAQILDFDGRAFFLRYVLWRVAATAAQPCMLTLEFVAGLLMVEGFNVPFCQNEIFAVVLRMAACAFLT